MHKEEIFWTTVAAIGQVLGAAATFCAVLVSLWIVRSERRERIRLTIKKLCGNQADPQSLDLIVFEAINVGLRVVAVTEIGWRSGWCPWGPDWCKHHRVIETADYIANANHPPYDIDPGRKHVTNIVANRFNFRREEDVSLFAPRKVPLIGKVSPPIYGILQTSRGSEFVVKVERNVSEFLASAESVVAERKARREASVAANRQDAS